jgi:hypothetical protein
MAAPENVSQMPTSQTFQGEANKAQQAVQNSGAKIPLPTLSEFQTKVSDIRKNNPVYAEAGGNKLLDRIANTNPAQVAMNRLGKLQPAERAQTGARFGAAAGLSAAGPKGLVMGAGLGAMVGRSLGLIQSGQQEANNRKGKFLETLDNLNIRDPKTGAVKFEDGGAGFVTPDKVFGAEDGKDGLPAYEVVDKYSPYVRRSSAVARPLARYITQGLLGYDTDDEKDNAITDSATKILVNTLQEGATDIDTVYNRARELSTKLGISRDQARAFFHVRRGMYTEEERNSINRGLDLIYG